MALGGLGDGVSGDGIGARAVQGCGAGAASSDEESCEGGGESLKKDSRGDRGTMERKSFNGHVNTRKYGY